MSLLQFSNIEDAFSPMSMSKKKKKEPLLQTNEILQQPIVSGKDGTYHPGVILPHQAESHTSLAQEIYIMQPYLTVLFMLLVVGMLYDIRTAVLDMKLSLIKTP